MTLNSNNTQTNCGTTSGYYKHIGLKEPVCQSCKDARNAYRRAYNKTHPEIKRAQDLRYLANHPGRRKKYDQKYRDNNREKTKAASLKWNKENPDRIRIAASKRRATKLQNGYEPYTETQVLDLYGTDCHLCNKPINLTTPRRIGKEDGWQLALHIDHVIPIIAGGSDTLENVRPSHAICNMKKGARMTFEPELDPDLFDDEDVEFDEDALDEEELDEWADEPEEDEDDEY